MSNSDPTSWTEDTSSTFKAVKFDKSGTKELFIRESDDKAEYFDYDDSTFNILDNGVVTNIDVDDTYYWVVQDNFTLIKYEIASPTSSHTYSETAVDIGVSLDGSNIYIISDTETLFTGNHIKKYNDETGVFEDVHDSPSFPIKINVDHHGWAWVVDILGHIHCHTGLEWIQ